MNTELLPAITIEPHGPHRATIIWLHGLGADGHDFEPIATEMNLPDALGVRFILPHAPKRPVSINGGYVMRAWYDIAAPDLSLAPDADGIRASREAVLRLVEHELAQGIPAEKIIVAGFSQGGAIALEIAIWHGDKVGGIIALSTYVGLPQQLPDNRWDIPVLMAHGLQDPVVPFQLGQASRVLLDEKNYDVEWRTYNMPHSVCWDEILDIRGWLIRRLGEA